jgi:fatty-acyl-CoA synthase
MNQTTHMTTETGSTFDSQLTPLRFLQRSAAVFPDKDAVLDGSRRLTYAQFAREAARLASALASAGVEPGDRVAYLCPNTAEMLIAHFGVPLAGAVLVPINTRLAPEEIRYICAHSGAKLLFVDAELVESAAAVDSVEELVRIDAPGTSAEDRPDRAVRYEEFLTRGGEEEPDWSVADELGTIAINYTSGTTGRPKGVMYTHRGAYLNALGEVIHSEHSSGSVYLWTLPMFHCNGWCTTWAVTAIGGTHVCLRAVRGGPIWELIAAEGVTHLNGAPTVLTTIANDPNARPLERPLTITTAGAAPSPAIIGQLEGLGARIIHVYGLTETYGPYSLCERQSEWDGLDVPARAKLLARQGVGMVQAEDLRVVDAEMNDVPRDAETIGEIVMRGNNVMKGYHDDPEATAVAFRGGWFHSGDLGVMHPDGYVEIRDRAKDIVISGGENISTVEVEMAILSHGAVLEAAVIGVPDERWGERPRAFVTLKSEGRVTEAELIEHVRSQLAAYKAPDGVEFVAELPKTATGKVQKHELRRLHATGNA